jgi:RNA recognition motif-containing protein
MNIFVAKLTPETTSEDLQNLFSHYGDVTSVKVIYDKETGSSKRYGFVEMPNEPEAKEAINQLNDSEFQGTTIAVKESQPREQQPQQSRQYDRNPRRSNTPYSGGGQRDFNRGPNPRRDSNRGEGDQRRNYGNRSDDRRY